MCMYYIYTLWVQNALIHRVRAGSPHAIIIIGTQPELGGC